MRSLVPSLGLCAAAAMVMAVSSAYAGFVGGEVVMGEGRAPYAAYSTQDDKFLVAWTHGPIRGQFISCEGQAIGSEFVISDGTSGTLYPSVAYNETNNEFLVTWDDFDRNDPDGYGAVYGHRIDSATGARLGPNKDIRIGTLSGWRSKVAWSSGSNSYLVVYYSPANGVHAQRVSSAGQRLGDTFTVSPSGIFSGYPGVGYGPPGNRFLVSWDNDDGNIHARMVDAATGAFASGILVLTSGGRSSRSNIAYDTRNNRWLVQANYGHPTNSYDQVGRFVNADGTLSGAMKWLAGTPCFEGETNFGCNVSYAPLPGRFFASFQLECPDGFVGLAGQEVYSPIAAVADLTPVGPRPIFSLQGQFVHNAADTRHNRYLTAWDLGPRIRARVYAAALAPTTNLAAVPGDGRISLSWTNSPDDHFTGTMIRYKTGGYPRSTTDGTLLVDRAGMPGSSDSYEQTGLTNGVTYYYAAFAHDVAMNFAEATAARAVAVPWASARAIISHNTFSTGADGWQIAMWKASTSEELEFGTMGWASDAGNTGGAMRSTGAGMSDNDDRCTREGGEIWKKLSTFGCRNILVSYQMRVGPLGLDHTGAGSGSCPVSHNLIDEQLTVYYSTNGGTNWLQAQWIARDELLANHQEYATRMIDFSGISGTSNNTNFALKFRWQFNSRPENGDYGDLDNIVVAGETAPVSDVRLRNDGVGAAVAGKVLYLKQGTFGYVEDPDRTSGIRVQGTIVPSEGDLVSVIGIMRTTDGGERYIQVNSMTANGRLDVKPLGVNNRGLAEQLLEGVLVRTWGVVKPGSITGNSFFISDGSSDVGIRVTTNGAPEVTEGELVSVDGAAGYESGRVLYAK